MNLETIPLASVEPDENNPRKDFGDLKALAESFELNTLNPGEPVNPIVVVKDGPIYRIVDGERRYRAMKGKKRAECHAIVCEDMDEANAMVAMVATDDKEKLTEAERSRGVQQMLLLGVEPKKVEKAAKLPKGAGIKVNHAMVAAGEQAETMSLDRLLAIDEVSDDPEAVQRLTGCGEGEWRREADRIRRERQGAAERAAMREACGEAGVPLVDDAPEGMSYSDACYDPEDVAEAWAGQPEGAVGRMCSLGYKTEVRFYAPAPEEKDPEEAARRERMDEIEAMMGAGEEARARWLAGVLPSMDDAPATCVRLGELFFERRDESWNPGPGNVVDELAEAAGIDTSASDFWGPQGAFAAYIYAKERPELPTSFPRTATGEAPMSDWDAGRIGRWLDWMGVLEADGYVPCEADAGLIELARGLVAEHGEVEG